MHVRISDQKMKDVLCLIDSVPLPQKSSAPSPEKQVNGDNENYKYLYIFIGEFFHLFVTCFVFQYRLWPVSFM